MILASRTGDASDSQPRCCLLIEIWAACGDAGRDAGSPTRRYIYLYICRSGDQPTHAPLPLTTHDVLVVPSIFSVPPLLHLHTYSLSSFLIYPFTVLRLPIMAAPLDTKLEQQNSFPSSGSTAFTRRPTRASTASAVPKSSDPDARLASPLAGYSHDELEMMGEAYARKYRLGDEDDVRAFRQGAVCAQDPTKHREYDGLSEADQTIMEEEFARRWHQPRLLYLVIVLCSTCAAVQGMGTISFSLYPPFQSHLITHIKQGADQVWFVLFRRDGCERSAALLH